MSERKQNIILNIDVHKVPLRVDAEDEEVFRKAGVYVNELFRKYQLKLMNEKSTETLWMYVALHTTVELMSDERDKSLEPVKDKLKELNNLIQEKLKGGQDALNP